MISFLSNWHVQTSFVLTLTSLLFCFRWAAPRFGGPASLLFAFCCLSAIYVWAWKDNRYLGLDVYNQMALRYFAADSIAKVFMIAVPLMVLSEDRERFSMLGTIVTSFFVTASSILVLWEGRHGCQALSCGGLIGNPSISLGLMVCMLPILVRSWRGQWPLLLLVGISVFLSQSSIAVGLLAAYCCLWFFPRSIKLAAVPVLLVSALFLIAHFTFGSELLNDSDRFKIWKHIMYHWAAPGNLLFGTGIGSYHVFSILLQNINPQSPVSPGSWWNSLHNDWLECLFWGGGVGLLLFISTYLSALFKLYRERDWQPLVSAILFGIYMFLDPALRNPIPVLFGAWLFVYALRKPKEYLV